MELKITLKLFVLTCFAGCFAFNSQNKVTIKLRDGNILQHSQSQGKFPNVTKMFDIQRELVISLRIQNSDLDEISSNQLKSLPNLEKLEIVNNKRLTEIHENTFIWNSKLSYIDLSGNSLNYISNDAFNGLFKKKSNIDELVLTSNQLTRVPTFNGNVPALKLLHLDKNPISELHSNTFTNMTHLTHLYLRETMIRYIPKVIFQNNQDIEVLDFSGTKELITIHEDAFLGSRLLELVLNGTSIQFLPSNGLDSLRELHLADTHELWEIPDGIIAIPSLRIVRVSSNQRFLCCAFEMKRSIVGIQRQEQQDMNSKELNRLCGTAKPISHSTRVYRDITTEEIDNVKTTEDPFAGFGGNVGKFKTVDKTYTTEDPFGNFAGGFGRRKRSLADGFGDGFVPRNNTVNTDGNKKKHDFGDNNFVTKVINHKNNSIICPTSSTGEIHYNQLRPVQCTPEPDALRPCDDIMGNVFLTALSWLVSIIALVGNSMVFSVLLLSRRSITVTKFLLMNLSFADLILALYLFILVSASGHTQGKYFNYVRSWQYGGGCALSGFLAILSSQLSILVLVVVTVERYFAIVYAMHFHRRVTMKHAKIAIGMCWFVAVLLALLPLIGINSYEEVALCLPFKVSSTGDLFYVGFLLISNIIFFVLVLVAYIRMYCVVRSPHLDSGPQRNDSEVAKRMALLVFTDFFCWAPIAFVGLISAFGSHEVLGMDVKKSKYLLVIFFPINSLCNPFLYAVSTNTFKRDFFDLLIRCGLCSDAISKANEGLYLNSNSISQKHSTRQETVVFHSQISRGSVGNKEKPLLKKLLMKGSSSKTSTSIPLMRSPPQTPETPERYVTMNDDVFCRSPPPTPEKNNGHVVTSPVISIHDVEMETEFINNNSEPPAEELRSMTRTKSDYDNVEKSTPETTESPEFHKSYSNSPSDECKSSNNFEQYDLTQEAIRRSPETPM